LWQPTAETLARAHATAFLQAVNRRWDAGASDYDSLWRWSVAHRDRFWQALWDYCGVIASRAPQQVVRDAEAMPGASWFPGADG
jgi:acetoacetyl-CoA synthetase